MLRDHVGASGYVRSGERLGRESSAAFRYPVLLARAHVASIIRDALGDRPSAGIVAGLAVGLQDALSREQWLLLSRSGTSHLMAISGLHIAMVAAVFAWLGGRVQRFRQRRGATGATRDASVVGSCHRGAGLQPACRLVRADTAHDGHDRVRRRRAPVASTDRRRRWTGPLRGRCAAARPAGTARARVLAVVRRRGRDSLRRHRARPATRSDAQLPAGPGRRHAGTRARARGQLRFGFARVRAGQPVRDPALHAADRARRAGVVRRSRSLPTTQARSCSTGPAG